jgi:hypothetical protein
VVEYPEPWGTPAARAELVAQLTDEVAQVLQAGVRSNGRERNAWLAWDKIGESMIDMYRDVIRRFSSRRGEIGS